MAVDIVLLQDHEADQLAARKSTCAEETTLVPVQSNDAVGIARDCFSPSQVFMGSGIILAQRFTESSCIGRLSDPYQPLFRWLMTRELCSRVKENIHPDILKTMVGELGVLELGWPLSLWNFGIL